MEQDPLPYFARFPAADILTSSDQLLPTVPDDRLEAWEKGGTVLLLEQSFCLYSNGVFYRSNYIIVDIYY